MPVILTAGSQEKLSRITPVLKETVRPPLINGEGMWCVCIRKILQFEYTEKTAACIRKSQ